MRSTASLGGREVYYRFRGNTAGYPMHLTLDPDEILTFVGFLLRRRRCRLHTATGNSDFCLIRWRPV